MNWQRISNYAARHATTGWQISISAGGKDGKDWRYTLWPPAGEFEGVYNTPATARARHQELTGEK